MLDRRELVGLVWPWLIASAGSGVGHAPAAAQTASTSAPKRLVLVHGRAQGGMEPDVLQTTWMDTLSAGAVKLNRSVPADLKVAFPFYGDVLDEYARAQDVPLTADIQTKGEEPNDAFLQFQAEVADDLRKRAGITDAQIEQEFGDDPTEKGPLNWRWVQAILRALDKNVGGLSARSIELVLRDVYLYTSHAGVRDEVDTIVRAAFTDEPTVVIAHSLGTVVAYSVMRNDPRGLKVPLYVTVGSPLGIRAVRDPFRPLRYPKPVGAWYNAFDKRDVVALNPLDATSFPVTPAVENNDTVLNHTDNRHGIVGYLGDPNVVVHILDALKG